MEGDIRSARFSCAAHRHFYPRPPGGGRRPPAAGTASASQISIHALRVEGDYSENGYYAKFGISIHALRVEGDHGVDGGSGKALYFYPRPPGGGRHQFRAPERATFGDFYPRPPGGGRLI